MALSLQVLFSVTLLALCSIAQGANCPPDFIENSGMCAYTIMTPLLNTWRQTQKKCLSFKSNIIMIKSDFEWKALMAGAASQLNNAPAGVWMGLNYTQADDKFYWFDGNEYSPQYDWGLWAPDEPGKPDRDKCVLVEKTGEEDRKFEWVLVDCESPHMMGIGICFCMAGTYSAGTIIDGNLQLILTLATATMWLWAGGPHIPIRNARSL